MTPCGRRCRRVAPRREPRPAIRWSSSNRSHRAPPPRVPPTGLEPVRLSASAFKAAVSTSSTTGADATDGAPRCAGWYRRILLCILQRHPCVGQGVETAPTSGLSPLTARLYDRAGQGDRQGPAYHRWPGAAGETGAAAAGPRSSPVCGRPPPCVPLQHYTHPVRTVGGVGGGGRPRGQQEAPRTSRGAHSGKEDFDDPGHHRNPGRSSCVYGSSSHALPHGGPAAGGTAVMAAADAVSGPTWATWVMATMCALDVAGLLTHLATGRQHD